MVLLLSNTVNAITLGMIMPPPPPGNQAKIRARNLERAIPDVLRTCHSKIFGHFEAESVAMFKNELLKS